MDRQNLTKFCIHIILDKVQVVLVNCNFSQICNRVTALGWCQNFFLFDTLRMDWHYLTKFCIPIIIDKIYVAIVKRHFSQICNGVSALDWCHKFVFAQHFENGCTELDQILYTLYHLQDLCIVKGYFFTNLQQSYSPWLMSEIVFCSISWKWEDRIQPNFVYTLSWKRSRLVL